MPTASPAREPAAHTVSTAAVDHCRAAILRACPGRNALCRRLLTKQDVSCVLPPSSVLPGEAGRERRGGEGEVHPPGEARLEGLRRLPAQEVNMQIG